MPEKLRSYRVLHLEQVENGVRQIWSTVKASSAEEAKEMV